MPLSVEESAERLINIPRCNRAECDVSLMVMRKVSLIMLLSAPAIAGPFKETVPTKDRAAITKAIQAALPQVDRAAMDRCQPALDRYNNDPEGNFDSILDAATCFRTAGSIGLAVVLWRQYLKTGEDRVKRRDAVRSIAIGYEAVALFSEAAAYGERYASEFGDEKDAQERLIRATCIRRQLGDMKEANSDTKQLTTSFKLTLDSDTLCNAVRPIAMPPTKP